MCGLAGFTTSGPESIGDPATILDAMLGAIAHRGPDQSGTKIFDSVALGHNRLIVMEPGGGRQPRVDGDSGNTLIYNGELYDHRAFDAEIRSSEITPRDHCDTETLFWLIHEHGVAGAARRVDGMFAFAYYTPADDTLYLARDAFGQKPLFYAQIGGELLFASELGALRRHPLLHSVTPDIDALSLYLMMEYVPGAATGIREIRALPPGHTLTWKRGRCTVEPWWRLPDEPRARDTDVAGNAAKLEGHLQTAVEQQLAADVPVGVFLSGGLDSSVIAALACRNHDDVSTFTIRFPQTSFDESRHAEVVARHIGSRHHAIELSGQACADAFERLIGKIDAPFADSSLLPTYLLCEATRRHVTVALGGDGADELFLGYPNFRLIPWAPLFARLPRGAARLLSAATESTGADPSYMNWRFLLRQLSNGFGRPAAQQSVYWMAAIAPAAQRGLWRVYPEVEERLAAQVASQFDASHAGNGVLGLQRHFLRHYLGSDILVKTDRASMYNSLEVRSPYLARSVADFALELDPSLLIGKDGGKGLLKRLAEGLLPRSTIERRKHGFAMPVASLLRGDFRDAVVAVLLDRSNPMYGLLHFDAVRRSWEDHASARRDRGKTLWALFMLAVFCRRHFCRSYR